MAALKFQNPWTTWITSDTHAFHKNITRGVTEWKDNSQSLRDFDTVEEMTQALADKINKRVLPGHDLIHLGDWSFGGFDKVEQFRKMINCKNIYFIGGNHDHNIEKSPDLQKLFTKCWAKQGINFQVEIRVGQHKYCCGHYKPAIWNQSHHGVRALWGHSHGTMPDDPYSLSFDIGVDSIEQYFPGDGFRPINFMEVEQVMSRKTWKKVDHHREETN